MSEYVILDGDQRLSRSVIWEIQRHYFRRSGIGAWRADEVPHYISSNPVMARAYGRVVTGFLRDLHRAADDPAHPFHFNPAQPLYIVELGAGSGRLAHHFLHQFYPHFAHSSLTAVPVKYVMTDFTPALLDFWRNHERLQAWVEAGVLDFALFDATAPQPLSLQIEKRSLTPDQVQNPVILIANYFFDSIPQDSFVIEEGQLCENLLTVYSTRPEPDLADPTIWERLSLAYEAIPLQQRYYAQESYNRILDSYEAFLPDTTLSFPNVGLDCVRFWQGFGNGCLLLLSSDRGHTLLESLLEQDDPLPNLHGSFSLMVNYHAIGQYVALADGVVLEADHYQDNLQVNGYLLGIAPETAVAATHAFDEAINQGGPDDFFALKQSLEPHYESLTLPQMLSYLRLSGWDAAIFADCLPVLRERIKTADPAWYGDVATAVAHIWERYLPLGEEPDLAAAIGDLLDEMGYEAEADSFREEAQW